MGLRITRTQNPELRTVLYPASRPSPHASSPLAPRLLPRASSPRASSPRAPRLLPRASSPRAPRLLPRASRPSHPAPLTPGAPAAGTGAASLRPSTLPSHVQRATCNSTRRIPSRLIPSRPSPLASRLIPSRLIPSRLAPLTPGAPAAGTGAASLRPSTLPSHVQRATCNSSRLSPLASRLVPPRLAYHAVIPR